MLAGKVDVVLEEQFRSASYFAVQAGGHSHMVELVAGSEKVVELLQGVQEAKEDHSPFVLRYLEVKSVTYHQARRVLAEEVVVLELHLRRLKALGRMSLYLEEEEGQEEALMCAEKC